MVHIPIDDQHPLAAAHRLGMTGGQRHRVVHTKPHLISEKAPQPPEKRLE
jgi:hypothetical protein